MEKAKSLIRQARSLDLLSIMFLVRECVRDMNKRNLFHWNTNYPNYKLLESDIAAQTLHIVKSKGIMMGMFTIDQSQTEAYNTIDWSADNDSALIVKRFAVHPLWLGKGIEEDMLDFIETKAKEGGFKAIRFDVAQNDAFLLKASEKFSYENKGTIMLDYQKVPFHCLEKVLG